MARFCAAPPPQAAASSRATVRAATRTPRALVTGLSSWPGEGVDPGRAQTASPGLLGATYAPGDGSVVRRAYRFLYLRRLGAPPSPGSVGQSVAPTDDAPVGVAVRWRRPDRS